jgi:hypothetical protein
MNLDLGDASMNPEMDAVNLDELPDSIFDLLEKFNASHPINNETQYCLFKWKGECFILWLKYKRLNGTGDEGLEVRSFYKCIKDEDLSKFDDENWIDLSNNF